MPVLVDTNLKLIAGHGRIQACRQLGWSEVPTICLEHLSDAQAKAFTIADNRLTENSVWDDQLLAGQQWPVCSGAAEVGAGMKRAQV